MGQYYLPALFETVKPISKETVITTVPPHYFDNGMKLTEHSYFGNSVVNTVINLRSIMPLRITIALILMLRSISPNRLARNICSTTPRWSV